MLWTSIKSLNQINDCIKRFYQYMSESNYVCVIDYKDVEKTNNKKLIVLILEI